MKKGLLFALITMFSYACSDKSDRNPYASDDEVLIKSLSVKTQKGYLLKNAYKGAEQEDSVLFLIKNFNSEGRLVEEIVYQDDGFTIDYDKKYNFTEENLESDAIFRYYPNNYRDREIVTRRQVKYDSKKHQTEMNYDGNGQKQRIAIECDGTGNVINRITYNEKNEKVDEENYVYTAANKLEKWTHKTIDGDIEKMIYKYNDKNLNTEMYYYKNNQLINHNEYKYNANNELIKESSYNPDEHCTFVATYLYYENGLLREKNSEYPTLENRSKTVNIRYRYDFY